MRRLLLVGLILLISGSLLGLSARPMPSVMAQQATETPEDLPPREVTLTINYTAYEWWLVRWKDNDILCYFWVDHEGLPTGDDVKSFCGTTLGSQWAATKPCTLLEGQTPSACSGLYMVAIGSHPATREVTVELPQPSVYLTLPDCTLIPPRNTCSSLPNLVFTAEEPLPNETIINIQGTFNGEAFSCPGSTCSLPLKPTGRQGAQMEFWAESSFGDASPHYTALIRVLPWGNFMDPDVSISAEQPVYYTDIISSQWRGEVAASCADVWEVFPDVGGPPPWLQTPLRPEDLFSDLQLYYLAGVLISKGEVDITGCPDGGLAGDLLANECGKDHAKDAVTAWQNQFNKEIWQVAKDTGVPANLIKNVFSQESQFWPGIYQDFDEAGLGQLTEQGTDAILLWNPSFFDQFCPLVLDQTYCNLGFGNLQQSNPELVPMLRGALFSKVDASCPDCPTGIDLTQAQFSVRVFAEGLKANCQQVGQILLDVTDQSPGRLSSYEDLWRMTLANYNAGSGCVARAINKVWRARQPMTWDNVAAQLEEGCRPAIAYVNRISVQRSGIQPTPTSWVYPGMPPAVLTPGALQGTPTPGAARATNTPRPTSTPRATNTPGPSPTPSLTPGAGTQPYEGPGNLTPTFDLGY